MHVGEKHWDRIKPEKQTSEIQDNIHPDINKIREQSKLYQLFQTEPHIYTWLTSDYTQKDIKKAIKSLKTTNHTEATEYQEKHTKYCKNTLQTGSQQY